MTIRTLGGSDGIDRPNNKNVTVRSCGAWPATVACTKPTAAADAERGNPHRAADGDRREAWRDYYARWTIQQLDGDAGRISSVRQWAVTERSTSTPRGPDDHRFGQQDWDLTRQDRMLGCGILPKNR